MKLWILSSSLLILIVIGLRSLLKGRISFRIQYALWLVVLLRLLIPFPVGRSPVSVENILPTSVPAAMRLQSRAEPAAQISGTEFPAASSEQKEEQPASAASPVSRSFNPETLLKTIWIIGSCVIILSGIISDFLFQRKLRRSRIAFSVDNIGLSVYVVHWLSTPCLAGLFRPCIYLTEESTASPVTLRHVLAHEKTHYAHGDHFWAWMRLAALALHWYNPLVWAAAILSKRDAELACDEAVLRLLGEAERQSYGETLISLSIPHVFRPLSLTTAMSESMKSLRERIVFIAHSPHMKRSVGLMLILLCITAVGITFPGSVNASLSEERIQDTFHSDDESVTVHLDLTQKDTFFPEGTSVYRLKYHEISTDETSRIVSALFGQDAPVYLLPPEQRDALAWDAYGTQEDFDRWLDFAKWLQTTDYPAIAAAGDSDRLNRVNTALSDFIKKYDHTVLYDSMPHQEDRQLLTWDGSTQDAIIEKNGIPYHVTHYVQGLSQSAEYHMYISPLDAEIYALYPYPTLINYGSETITPAQIQSAEQTVRDMISKMGLNGWEIRSSSPYPHASNALTRYTIRIILEHRYDSRLVRCDDPFPLENPVDQISFEFSSDGRLYRMEYVCPFEAESVAEPVTPISYEEALKAVKAYCSASTADQFGTVRFADEKSGEESELVAQADLVITDLKPGLAYIGQNKPYHTEENGSASLIPAIAVYGATTLSDRNGIEIKKEFAQDASWSVLHDDARPLFILNGLDGSLLENFLDSII